MNVIKQHFKRAKFEYINVFIIIFSITVMLAFQYNWSDMDINVPIQYNGGDDFSLLVNAKMFTQQGWNMETDRLGAPFDSEFYDFTANSMHNVDVLITKFFAQFTDSVGAIANLSYFSIFYLCGIISYLVMRELKVKRWAALGGSFVFSMASFIFQRNMGHFVLSCCYFVPLSVLLCMWIYTRDDYLVFDKNFFRNPRHWFTLVFACLIANNGIVYYPLFTCFMLVIAGLVNAVNKKDARYLLKSLVVIGCIVLFILIALIPTIIYIVKNGQNSAAIERFGLSDSELYGLRIIELFIPANSHGISKIDGLKTVYREGVLHYTEGTSSYLGIMAIIGFFTLLVTLFIRTKNAFWNKMRALSHLNLGLVLFGTAGGFGTVFTFFVTDKIRGYCRVSIFIMYISILAVCIAACKLSKKHMLPVISLFLLLSVVSAWDQFPVDESVAVYLYKETFESDKNFVESIEAQVSAGSMIYQLPYHEYPEGGPVNDMVDYHLYIGFIHSNTLKWSYGSMKGSKYDMWNQNIAESSVENMVAGLKESGFAGIYIDRRAYDTDEINVLESSLALATGSNAQYSDNENLSFFKF